ncbi:hypothetical protein HPULCUR_004327 [Helicostylum pulchrum]|uniref:GATA-type domain-containing protein n=1 Tax=Helicostylum pulchrum TaxID=562976 RepID=A0ABP9XVX1_9FUNG
MNLHHQRKISDSSSSSNNNTDRLKLPPISAMDDFLPSRSWVPPASTSSPDTSSSLPTPPQPDQWKSPPYKNRNELSRDSSYTYYKSSLFSNTSPILMQQTSPQQPPESQQQRSSYFQYTSKAYNTNINNAPSPSSSYNNSTYTPNRIENDIEEVVRQCHTLCDNMVQRKSQFINSHSSTSTYQDLNSTRPWLDDMIGRANEVLNALLRLRKHQLASEQLRVAKNVPEQYQGDYVSSNEQNKPRTWRIGSSSPSSSTISNNIRQRKRGKRPAFQGRCHSCNISETPEWRRGPDGARTLCNACGLHYAKLARKQQENRGMSSNSSGILGSSSTRRLSNQSGNSFGKLTSSSSPPPVDDIILDRSPTG